MSSFEMAVEVCLDGEACVAERALEGAFVGVRPNVNLKLYTQKQKAISILSFIDFSMYY